jgi:hypothetical protein
MVRVYAAKVTVAVAYTVPLLSEIGFVSELPVEKKKRFVVKDTTGCKYVRSSRVTSYVHVLYLT